MDIFQKCFLKKLLYDQNHYFFNSGIAVFAMIIVVVFAILT